MTLGSGWTNLFNGRTNKDTCSSDMEMVGPSDMKSDESTIFLVDNMIAVMFSGCNRDLISRW